MIEMIVAISAVGLILGLIFYPWLSFALLLAIPIIKAGAVYYLPIFSRVDLTLLACLLAGVIGVWNLIRRPGRGFTLHLPWWPLLCVLTIGAILLVSITWTTAPTYGFRKAYRFLGIGIPFLLLPTFFVQTRKDGHAMILMTIIVGTLAALAVVINPDAADITQQIYGHGYSRSTVLGANPIMVAVISGIGLLPLLASFALPGSASKILRYAMFIVLPLGLAAILRTGTRSGLLGLLLTAMLLPLLAGRRARTRGMFLLLIALPITVVGGLAYVQSQSSAASRWDKLAQSGGILEATSGRLPYYTFCLQHWHERPVLGHGSGSFAMDAYGVDEPAWPHNIILEAMYEIGMVGTVALLALFLFTAKLSWTGLRLTTSAKDRFLVLAPVVVVIMLFIQSMVHSDLDGLRYLFLFIGLLHANVTQVRLSYRKPRYRKHKPAPIQRPVTPPAAWA